jgi:hypothetical protein
MVNCASLSFLLLNCLISSTYRHLKGVLSTREVSLFFVLEFVGAKYLLLCHNFHLVSWLVHIKIIRTFFHQVAISPKHTIVRMNLAFAWQQILQSDGS